MNVISLCDHSAVMVMPWVDAGFLAHCYDLQNETGCCGLLYKSNTDVRKLGVFPMRATIVFAFPPCTNLAVSGARWFQDKGLQGLIDGLEVVEACRKICEASGAPWMLENPVSTLSTYWRKPDFMFDPCDYAGYLDDPAPEAYTKRTCLWTGGGFVMPEKRRVEPVLGSKMHLLPPSADRANLRSRTPAGFAKAVFMANGKLVSA